ncbi:MAG: GyrI-like domain-containing protein [Coriobacteriia bacterium]|nr:GyrI-like domain-containing protein [Coriobacteriia bacterium]
MPAFDFKKAEKHLYQPKAAPVFVDVPEMTFITIEGEGDPNTSETYASAIEVLYGLSYSIKMRNKPVLNYVVLPLEGLWSFIGDTDIGTVPLNKDSLAWTALIRQPDFVTTAIFSQAVDELAKKKPGLDASKAHLTTFTEGQCVHIMHIGSYDDEPASISLLYDYAHDNGYKIQVDGASRHHEIYLNDPRKVDASKLKTVIRYPVIKA